MSYPPKQPLSDIEIPQLTPNTIILDDVSPTDSQKLQQIKEGAEQNAQARLLLIQLQWLIIILMIGAMVWQHHGQKQLAEQIDDRLKQTESFTTRMNDMDDRLFAMTPSHVATFDTKNAQNDLVLLRLLIRTAQKMYGMEDYEGASEILEGVLYGVTTNQYSLAAPIRVSLMTHLNQDLERIDNAKASSDSWQAYLFLMKAVQNFLKQNHQAQTTTPNTEYAHNQNAFIFLNLAIGSANIRQKDTMIHYLTETKEQLLMLKQLHFIHSDNMQSQNTPAMQAGDNQADTQNIHSLDEAIYAIDKLLANIPKQDMLTSGSVLDN